MIDMALFHARDAHEVYDSGFYRGDFDFDVRILLGSAPYEGADAGEVLQAITGVADGDHAAWYDAWTALGTRIRAIADTSAGARHPVSAASAFLRAANYFAVAVNAAEALADDDRLATAFRAHRSAWDRFADTCGYPVERLAIPYEDTPLPGYLLSPADAGTEPRPTLVLVNGSDGPISGMWTTGGLGGLRRGYRVLMFDGPGQQSMLFDHGVPFRPDWEAVLTPVVDLLLSRGDVDGSRLAAYGISQAGYWLPRALTAEHRIAAAIVDPGVVDVSASWIAHMPKHLLELVHRGAQEEFDRDMAIGMKASKALARTWAFRARPYGGSGYYDTMTRMLGYRLSPDDAKRITTPLFVTSPEKEQFWPGQSERLVELAPDAVLQPFTAAEGADYHCQPMARLLTDQRMFDWLDEKLGR
jgi:hypothetical protein